MTQRFLVLTFLLFYTVNLFSQNISEDVFNKLLTNKRVVYFDSKNKKYFGCGLNLDCMGLPVFFKSIVFKKEDKRLRIEAYINPIIDTDDTTGANIFRIFIAKPGNGKLKSIRILADVEDTIKEASKNTVIDLRKGRLRIDFVFSKSDCLYMESGEMFNLKEYNITSLLESN